MMYATRVVKEIEQNDILDQIDIQVAVDYFGVTELLDTIGVTEIVYYLENFGERESSGSPLGRKSLIGQRSSRAR